MVIMVITQDENRRTHISAFLSGRGYTVVIPTHRGDIPGLMRERHPDVVVLDMYLSEPSGIENLKTLRDEGYRGKVIALGGISIRSQLQEAFRFGIDHLIGGMQGKDGVLDLEQLKGRSVVYWDVRWLSSRDAGP